MNNFVILNFSYKIMKLILKLMQESRQNDVANPTSGRDFVEYIFRRKNYV